MTLFTQTGETFMARGEGTNEKIILWEETEYKWLGESHVKQLFYNWEW